LDLVKLVHQLRYWQLLKIAILNGPQMGLQMAMSGFGLLEVRHCTNLPIENLNQ